MSADAERPTPDEPAADPLPMIQRYTPGVPYVHGMTISHRIFRTGLGVLPALVRSVRPGDRDHARRLRRHYDMVSSSLDRHHGYEDEHIWPTIVERAPADAALAHRMETQHARVAQHLAALPTAWDAFQDDPQPATGEPLADRLDALCAALNEHLDDEEQHLLPLLQRYLSVEEWNAFSTYATKATRPYHLLLEGGMIYRQMSPEEMADMTRLEPAAMWGIKLVSRPVYRRYERRLTTPTRRRSRRPALSRH
ncbi:hemerythrin domain-containing protein [Nakamurella deserti]|uniref:hemerythrin domain-containing protein n=1 Tax=Nakamurella deserti TaxID=2164074 RepID=UPI000DBE3558|nr:hemerythrin domain-containing protein [Nakamurella deserti]